MVLVNITLPFDEKKTKQQLCCSRDAQIDSASRHEVGPVASLSRSVAGDGMREPRAATGIVHRTWRAAVLLPVAAAAALVSLPTRRAIVAEQCAANSNDKKIWRQWR